MTDEQSADGFRALFRTEDGIEIIASDAAKMDLAH